MERRGHGFRALSGKGGRDDPEGGARRDRKRSGRALAVVPVLAGSGDSPRFRSALRGIGLLSTAGRDTEPAGGTAAARGEAVMVSRRTPGMAGGPEGGAPRGSEADRRKVRPSRGFRPVVATAPAAVARCGESARLPRESQTPNGAAERRRSGAVWSWLPGAFGSRRQNDPGVAAPWSRERRGRSAGEGGGEPACSPSGTQTPNQAAERRRLRRAAAATRAEAAASRAREAAAASGQSKVTATSS